MAELLYFPMRLLDVRRLVNWRKLVPEWMTDKWIKELKFNGWRMIAVVSHGTVHLFSRSGVDWTHQFPKVVDELSRLGKKCSFVLDGEMVALDEEGKENPGVLRRSGIRATYYAFDLLEHNGVPLINQMLRARRAKLEKILKVPKSVEERNARFVLFSEPFDDLESLCEAASQAGYEGVVLKDADSRYSPGRSTSKWIKVKNCMLRETVDR